MEVDYIEMAILELEKRNGISASFARTMYNGMKSRIAQLEAAQPGVQPTCGTLTAFTSCSTPEDDSAPEVLSSPPTNQ